MRKRLRIFGFFNFLAFTLFLFVLGVIASALGWIKSPLDVFRWIVPLSLGLIFLILALVILAIFGLRRFSRPLDDLLAASDRVAEGGLSVRLEEKGPREIRSVARAFNSMAERP